VWLVLLIPMNFAEKIAVLGLNNKNLVRRQFTYKMSIMIGNYVIIVGLNKILEGLN